MDKNLEETIDDMSHVMWVLLRKLVASEYDNATEQLKDVIRAGHLATEIKVLRAARNIKEGFYARPNKVTVTFNGPQPVDSATATDKDIDL